MSDPDHNPSPRPSHHHIHQCHNWLKWSYLSGCHHHQEFIIVIVIIKDSSLWSFLSIHYCDCDHHELIIVMLSFKRNPHCDHHKGFIIINCSLWLWSQRMKQCLILLVVVGTSLSMELGRWSTFWDWWRSSSSSTSSSSSSSSASSSSSSLMKMIKKLIPIAASVNQIFRSGVYDSPMAQDYYVR